ncbi:MAG: GIY-YIG nuclease family protein [Bacteroidia bacterium]|nr:GIY-YIG nuclease family protein [Bacteroidia bacterium]
MFFLYIIFSPSRDKFYIGITDDLSRRLEEHNSGIRNQFTKSGIPWVLQIAFELPDRRTATQLELKFKKSKNRGIVEWVVASKLLPPKWGFEPIAVIVKE